VAYTPQSSGASRCAIFSVSAASPTSAAAMCDKDVTQYTDFREVIARPDIDIIHIATPPHWHGLISVLAAKAGKDIWCEKPMTRTIAEGLGVIDTVQRHGRIFRINTWFRFNRDTRDFYQSGISVEDAKKAVSAGMLGWPVTVTIGKHTGFNWKMIWCGRTDLMPQPVPDYLDYDMWLGPAPYKPYNADRTSQNFRGYWDYDGGGLGDMGQHYMDPAQYILGKDHTSPVSITCDAPQQHYDAVGFWNRVEMTYADGCKIILDGAGKDEGAPFISGPKGSIRPGMQSDIPDLKKKIAALPNPPRQEDDFLKCVRERIKFGLNEENGHRSATLVNLAKISVRLGRKLTFDPDKQVFINDEEANRLRQQPMRAPWAI